MTDVPVDEDGLGLAHPERANCRLRTTPLQLFEVSLFRANPKKG